MRKQVEAVALAAERKRAISILRKGGMSAAAIKRAIGGAVETDRPRSKADKHVAKKIEAIADWFCFELRRLNWNVTLRDLRVDHRQFRSIVAPRMVAMWLVRDMLGGRATFQVIGLFFGGRDHSTVMHAFQKGAPEQMERDPRLAIAADATRRKLAGRRDV